MYFTCHTKSKSSTEGDCLNLNTAKENGLGLWPSNGGAERFSNGYAGTDLDVQF